MEEKEAARSNLRLYLVGVISAMGQVCTGMVLGYSSFLIPQLEAEAEEHGNHLTAVEKSLTASLSMVGVFVGSLFCGSLANALGRKKTLLAYYCTGVVGFIVPAVYHTTWVMLLGRVIQGISISTAVTQVYVGEVSTVSLRSVLGALCTVGVCLGITVVISLGSVLHWFAVTLICAAFPAATAILTIVFSPESPSWLYVHGHVEEAKKVLHWLRGESADLTRELQMLEEALKVSRSANEQDSSKRSAWSQLRRPEVFKPCLLLVSLMLLMSWSGGNVVVFFAVNIFKDLDFGGNAFIPAIIVSFVRMIGAATGTVLVRKLDNRTLLLWTSSLMCVSALGIGLMTFYHKAIIAAYPESEFAVRTIVPVVLVVVLMLNFGAGVGAVPWTLMGILSPPEAGTIVSGISMFAASIGIFSVVQSFPFMEESVGIEGTYWVYSIVCVLNFAVSFLCLPQTKGLSRAQISLRFSQKKGQFANGGT